MKNYLLMNIILLSLNLFVERLALVISFSAGHLLSRGRAGCSWGKFYCTNRLRYHRSIKL